MLVRDQEGWIATAIEELIEEAILRITQTGLSAIVKRAGPKSVLGRAAGVAVPAIGASIITADVYSTLSYLEREHQAFSRPGPPAKVPVPGTFPIYQIGGRIV